VQRALEVFNPRKAILNASHAEQGLPTIWEMADVTPLSPSQKETSGRHQKGIETDTPDPFYFYSGGGARRGVS